MLTCRRFADTLAGACARLGVDMARYTFIAVDSHHLLLAGLPAHSHATLAQTELYRCRWQVELFFKRIKQHLRIKAFFGTSENAVRTQVWIAVSIYVLVAIVRKRLTLDASLYETLQILSLTMFETTPLHQLLKLDPPSAICSNAINQLNLFES
jgi:hypothetical protein